MDVIMNRTHAPWHVGKVSTGSCSKRMRGGSALYGSYGTQQVSPIAKWMHNFNWKQIIALAQALQAAGVHWAILRSVSLSVLHAPGSVMLRTDGGGSPQTSLAL